MLTHGVGTDRVPLRILCHYPIRPETRSTFAGFRCLVLTMLTEMVLIIFCASFTTASRLVRQVIVNIKSWLECRVNVHAPPSSQRLGASHPWILERGRADA